MHSLFLDGSVDNVLLQTSTSRFKFIDIPKECHINLLLHNTANIAKWTVIRAVGGYILQIWSDKIYSDFFLYFNSCCIRSVSLGNAETDVK